MNTSTVMNHDCVETLERLDRWMDRQMPEAEAASVEAHLKSCPSCAAESDLRIRLRNRMRTAVRATEPSPYLATRILTNVRQEAERPRSWFGWKQRLATAAAMVVLCVGTTLVVRELGYLRFTAESREQYIGAITARVSSIMSVGLSQHVHCGVWGRMPKVLPKPEEVVNQLPPGYEPLLPIVQKNIPAGFVVYKAHACSYKKRSFAHFGLRHGNEVISLLITDKGNREGFDVKEAVTALTQSGIQVYGSGVQRFQIAAFEAGPHLAFIVSDMPKERNRELMVALGPAVAEFLKAHKS